MSHQPTSELRLRNFPEEKPLSTDELAKVGVRTGPADANAREKRGAVRDALAGEHTALDPHWEKLSECVVELGDQGHRHFWSAIFDAREGAHRSVREAALLRLHGTEHWPPKLLNLRKPLISDEAIEAWNRVLEVSRDRTVRQRILNLELDRYELDVLEERPGEKFSKPVTISAPLTVRDVIDKAFRRGDGPSAQPGPASEPAWWVLMHAFTYRLETCPRCAQEAPGRVRRCPACDHALGFDLGPDVSAKLTSDVLRWFVSGESLTPDAIKMRWRRSRKDRPHPERPSARWDGPLDRTHLTQVDESSG